MAGNKISGADPLYPAIARSARVQGTVVIAATISKSGSIENLHVVSGPPLLVSSAVEAVKTWRYRPYLLNGDPVEVETTINVVFNLGG
jgi:protein TonB